MPEKGGENITDPNLGFALIGRALDYVEHLDESSPLIERAWRLADQVAAEVRSDDRKSDNPPYTAAKETLERLRKLVCVKA